MLSPSLLALVLVAQVGERTPAPPPVERILVPTQDEWTAIASKSALPTDESVLAEFEAQGLSLVLYDVRDLMDPSRRPGMDATPPPEDVQALFAKGVVERSLKNLEEFAELASLFMEPPLEGPNQELRALRSGSLAAMLTQEQHLWLLSFLDLQRRHAEEIYVIEIRFVKLAPEAVHRVGLLPPDVPAPSTEPVDPLTARALGEGDPLPQAKPRQPRFLDDLELATLLRNLEQEPSAEVVASPRIMNFNRSRSEVMVMNQISYVEDYEVHEHVEPGDQTVVDPVVKIAKEGVRAQTQVVRLGPDLLGVNYEIEFHDLVRPIQTYHTVYGIVGLPETTLSSVTSAMAVADGVCAVLPPFPVEDKLMSVMIRVEGIEPEALESR